MATSQKVKETALRCYRQNRGKRMEQMRAYYLLNKGKVSAQQKEYYRLNRERILNRRRAAYRKKVQLEQNNLDNSGE